MAITVGSLLARERELAALDALLDAAADGAGGALVIVGTPGIGKSALLSEAAERARRRGFGVCAARADERDRALAFGVVRDLFGALAEPGLLSGAAAAAGPALDPAPVGELTSRGDSVFEVAHGLYWLTANLAEQGPLLVAVDDADLADQASLRCLEFLSRRADELPLALVVVWGAAGEGLPSGLRASRLVPAPLSTSAVGEMVRAALGEDGDPAFVEACRAASGGNPYRLHALLDELVASGAAPPAEAVTAASAESPVRRKLERLADERPVALALAQAVAVLGRDAELGYAAQLAGVEVPVARDAAVALAALGVLEHSDPPRFADSTLEAAVYAEIGVAQRSAGHRRAAELLDPGEPDRAVVHLLSVQPAGDPWVRDRLVAGAGRALARGSADAGRTLLERALDEAPAGDDRARVLLALSLVERNAGDVGAVSELEAAHALATSPDLRAEIVRELIDAHLLRGDDEGARSLLEWAKRELPDPQTESWLELEAGRVALLQMQASAAEAAALIGRLARVERAHDDTPATRRLLALLAFHRLVWVQTTGAEVGALAERALAGGRLIEEAEFGRAAFAALSVLQGVERDRELEAHLVAATAGARARGQAAVLAVVLAFRGRLALFRGRLAEAEADLRESLALNDATGMRVIGEFALAALVNVLVERGDTDGADALLDERPFPAEGSGNRYLLLLARAALRRAQGRPGEAAEDVRAADRQRSGPSGASILSRTMLARAAHAAGEIEQARRTAREAVERAERWGVAGTLGIALRTQGLVEEPALGLELLTRAEATLRPTPRRLEHARTLVELGAARQRAGQAAASEALEAGMEMAHFCAAAPLVERARDELVACGVDPPLFEPAGAAVLTPAELRVARLAASGRSEREIAQSSFLARRTVEQHLGRISRKLGTTARDRLAVLLDPLT